MWSLTWRLVGVALTVTLALSPSTPDAAQKGASSEVKIDPEKRLSQIADETLPELPQVTFGENPFNVMFILYRTTDPEALALYRRMKDMADVAEYHWIAFGQKTEAKRGAAWMAYKPSENSLKTLLTNEANAPAVNEYPELTKAYAGLQARLSQSLAPVLKENFGKGLTSPMIIYQDAYNTTYVIRGLPKRETIKDAAEKANW